MKKKNIIILIIALILVGIGVTSMFLIPARQTAFADTFTPIYCNDYEFYCCVEKETPTKNINLGYKATYSSNYVWQCPPSVNHCIVSFDLVGFATSMRKTSNYESCTYNPDNGIFDLNGVGLECDSYQELGDRYNGVIASGEHLFLKKASAIQKALFDKTFSVSDREFYNKLYFCGRAGCSVGQEVRGADQCTFVTDESIYDENGNLIKSVGNNDISYTVHDDTCALSWQSGDRHICGNVEEQCEYSSDCSGHTYGNFECNARTLQEYGCRQLYNVPNELEETSDGYVAPFDQRNSNYGTILNSRCEITNAKQVQCCGDTDCGTNAFCDNNPNSATAWTCQQGVECINDYDCGVSEQCDIVSKQIKKPICDNGQCGYDIIASVSCCGDSDCAEGYYCDADNECKESTAPKSSCPYGCCEGETRYFDRACPDGITCCVVDGGVGRACQETCEIEPHGECPPIIDIKSPLNPEKSWIVIEDYVCKIKKKLTWVTILFGALTGVGIFAYGYETYVKPKTKKKKIDVVSLISLLLISGGAGFLVYFLLDLMFDFIFSFWGVLTLIVLTLLLAFMGKIKKLIGIK